MKVKGVKEREENKGMIKERQKRDGKGDENKE